MSADRIDIAIVGMAGLYPDAPDIDVFWSNILNCHDAVREADESWLGGADILDPGADGDMSRIYTRRGGFLGDLSRFDPRRFGTMPVSVEGGQPDQFLALKVCQDALVDAGYAPDCADHTRTGVILGHAVHAHRANSNGMQQVWFHAQMRSILNDLFPEAGAQRIAEAVALMQDKLPTIAVEAVPGLVPNIMTGRICNRLGLMGPNYIIDAACSSTLIAVNIAANELRAGRADLMLAGGVNTTTSPLVYNVFCSIGALSRQGIIRPFGAEAAGTVLGEGAGALVLKRLEDALRDEDRIYGVVKAVGQSSDGKSTGLMAPRLEGEVLAMRRAYELSRIDPASIGLVEAHGTGIPLGDRTEVNALREVFGARIGGIPQVPIGSVKSMIGHCIPAAGSAALIKSALALTHRIVPPTLCGEVDPGLGLEQTPFYVATEARPWVNSAPTPRRAAINAFGFGGINAHLVLEESPLGRDLDATACYLRPGVDTAFVEQVFAFAAPERDGLIAAISAVSDADAGLDPAGFATLARETWQRARAVGSGERMTLVAADPQDLAKKVKAALKQLGKPGLRTLQTRNGIYYEAAPMGGKVAFLFPGEMAQYPGLMADALMAFPPVRDWVDFIASLSDGQRALRLQDAVFPPSTCVDDAAKARLNAALHQVDYGSEIVFAADQAVFWILRRLGIRPEGMLGHSTGENAAIVASGRLRLDRAAVGEMIGRMNAAFNSVNESGAVPQGVLLTVAGLDRATFLSVFERHEGLHFTMDNCPNQAIMFGPESAVDAAQSDLVAAGAVCTRLPICWGYHTDFVAPMAERFRSLFAGVQTGPSDVTLYSCATAAPFPEGAEEMLDTAILQYVSRVRFTEAIERMYADGYRVFVECGPNAMLTAFVRDILGERRFLCESADNRRRGMVSHLRHLVARLVAAGIDLDYPDLLDPAETNEGLRRRTRRAEDARAPLLPSNLPFLKFDSDEKSRLRSLLGCDAPATASAAQPKVAGMPETEAAMRGHIEVMDVFLKGQERIGRISLGAPALAGAARRDRHAQGPIGVLDIAPFFDVPFELDAVMMRGQPGLDAMARHLAEPERSEAARMSQRTARWTEWALGRLAAKHAARGWLARRGLRAENADIAVLKTEAGAPVLSVAGQQQMPSVSISHVEGCAVAAVADLPWRVGIDFDRPDRVREPTGFLGAVLCEAEGVARALPANAETAIRIWTAKEAAAKAVGQGMQGRPEAFVLEMLDPVTGRARVVHAGHGIKIQTVAIMGGFCSLGFVAAG
ncbi:acyl transferase domain-containing protein [Rhodovulum bhavnagarense]|uniref:Acyl transferase domain-containing protein n=1 Tax=Rhodovulum bhavnagarense TaxID=992286 RepID=A0A4R2RMC8_9RHOB|nr:type I polyketide synthase [Rhodovulum bhavnagarense]TCP63427.1 acyl transferase domain-containing protein [Rhodovulum bhavnagarense]